VPIHGTDSSLPRARRVHPAELQYRDRHHAGLLHPRVVIGRLLAGEWRKLNTGT
jgi:hypothetical protein